MFFSLSITRSHPLLVMLVFFSISFFSFFSSFFSFFSFSFFFVVFFFVFLMAFFFFFCRCLRQLGGIGSIWSHANPSACGVFTPSTVPARVYIEAGGGGGGGGEAVRNDGAAGSPTVVLLQPGDVNLMTANGGDFGRSAAADYSGRVG